MIIDRYLEQDDMDLLELSLAADEHHSQTKSEFFTEAGTACKVYEDEKGIICFVKGSPVIRLDIQWISNYDRRNIQCMLEGFPPMVARAQENGFKEVIFNSEVELLRKFCIKRLGFVPSNSELIKAL